jgi:serine protease Do
MRLSLVAGALVACAISSGALAQPYQAVSFARVETSLTAGAPIGVLSTPWRFGCSGPSYPQQFSGALQQLVGDSRLDVIVKTALRSIGVPGDDPSSMFTAASAAPDLQLGARITGFTVNGCGNDQLKRGSISMDVEWQLYSTARKKLVARISTNGVAATKEWVNGWNGMKEQAFTENVRALLQSSDFKQALSQPSASEKKITSADAALAYRAGLPGPRTIPDAGRAVATVFTDNAMGSAFLISTDGYLLTNHHVVGDVTQVKVRWSDRSESAAEVIRSDSKRDVALLKIVPNGREPLSIRGSDAVPGEPVFAIGTPLEKSFQGTVTKGIVSANRMQDGQRWVQSDVAVDHGNSGGPLLDEKGQVIGMTAWGYSPDGVSHNLNFFVPIADALTILRIGPAKDDAS